MSVDISKVVFRMHSKVLTAVSLTLYLTVTLYKFLLTSYLIVVVGRDSSVGIATRYGLDGPGIESR
jgi:hypothetical protein